MHSTLTCFSWKDPRALYEFINKLSINNLVCFGPPLVQSKTTKTAIKINNNNQISKIDNEDQGCNESDLEKMLCFFFSL